MLEVDIQKRLGKFHLRSRFDANRETLALLGASGCGKSMTLKCIAGIEKPDSGRIVLDGRVLFDSARHIDLPPQRRRVGYLFQQYALFPNMTVKENILAGAHALPKRQREEKAAAMIASLRLDGLESKKPFQLSGGQQQRTALARILASEPEVILLDEPLSALDSYLKWQLEMELADVLRSFDGVCVWVSHDRDEVYRNCKSICIMENGATQPVREKHELFSAPGTVGAARLSGCKNYALARRGDTHNSVFLPQWGVELQTALPVPDGLTQVGLRVHSLHTAQSGAKQNRIACTVERVTEDVFSYILMLRVANADSGAPRIRMELDKSDWERREDKAQIEIFISPDDILLLE